MDTKLEAYKKAIERESFKKSLEFLRTGKSPGVERVKLKRQEEETDKLALIQECVARGRRAAKAEKQAEAIVEVVGHTRFLSADRKAQKKRKRKAAKKAQRDTKDSGLWDRYEAFRAMRAKIKRGEKQLAAATDVKKASKGNITIKPEALVRYYREWMKKRKTD